MIDIVAVLRAEDAVLDFLSVLTAPEPRYRQDEAHEVHVLLGDIAEHLVLPAGLPPAERLAAVARNIRPVDESVASPGPTSTGRWTAPRPRPSPPSSTGTAATCCAPNPPRTPSGPAGSMPPSGSSPPGRSCPGRPAS
ncbi:hypothetical protein ACFXA0_30425 [Streptomyces cyaneofuscatus]|uniref:hypothetical protein n=1 Tax=Streptomyces cyaneofuscatus TaxID=66883 RepID=UPI0036CF9F27